MKKQVILDTGPLIALLNRRDLYHNWVTHKIKSINPPFLTCEAVITEACFLSCRDIGDTNAVIDLAQNGCHIVPNLLTNANKDSTMHGDEILTK